MLKNKFTTQSGTDNTDRAEGVMLYVLAGDAGILVYFGGVQMVAGIQVPSHVEHLCVRHCEHKVVQANYEWCRTAWE